jgi:glycosyltransferase involved in cell wall biosynthesis
MKMTVAITVWRRELLLPHAIQSVLDQTHEDWEILVYSDGGSRRTRQLVEELRPTVPISYQRLPRRPRLRGNHLRRLALEQARGTHVCILGHDCILYPTYLETHARNICSDPDVVSVVPIAYWKDSERRANQPLSEDVMAANEGEIDLLCVAFPRDLSLRADCFGRGMQKHRHADYLSFAALRRLSRPVFAPGPVQAAHF